MARKYDFEVEGLSNGLYVLTYRGEQSDPGKKQVPFQLTFKTAEQAKEYASKWVRGINNDPAIMKAELFTVEVEDANPSGDEVRSVAPADPSNPA